MRFALFARCAWQYRAILATGAALPLRRWRLIGIEPKRAIETSSVSSVQEASMLPETLRPSRRGLLSRAKSLLVHPAHHHQKPLKLGIVAGAFPEIDETANNLNVVEFVVSIAIDSVC